MTNAQRHHILHLTDGNRGGSQRHLIDLVRSDNRSYRHYVLAAAADTIGLTDVDGSRLLPLDRARVADWPAAFRSIRHALGIGFVHAHALAPLLTLAEAPERPLDGVAYGVTLHDLRAVDPEFFDPPRPEVTRDAAWIARCGPVLRRATAVVVPSAWLRDIVRDAYPGVDPHVVANGIAPAIPASGDASQPLPFPIATHTYAVVGALGAHKGRETLDRVASAIDDERIGGVVLGYTDTREEPGWLILGRLWLHGRYEPEELPALLAAYRCRLAYFPNIVPESFSYVLSEAWQAGVPVLAPAIGALGARVADVGGGWLLDDPLDAAAAARRIAELLGDTGDAMLDVACRRIAASPDAVPSLAAMRTAIEAVYRATASPANADPDAGWTQLAALFRHARIPGIDASLLGAQWAALAHEEQSLRAWSAKQGTDVGQLKARNERLEAEFAPLTARNGQLERDLVAIGRRNAELEQHLVALRERNLHVEADLKTLVVRNLQLEADVSGLTRRNIELHTDVVALKERNTLVEAGLAAIGQRNVRVEQDAAMLRRELDAARDRLAALERRLARTARLERVIERLPGPLRNLLLSDG